MAVLLTGVGYIGAVLLRRMLERGERVVGLENFYCTPREALANVLEGSAQSGAHPASTFTLVEGDVANPDDVARAFNCAAASGEPLAVYHLAAQPSAAVAARDPDYTERTNLVGARLVLEAASAHAAPVVFGGSFRVYGDDFAPGQVVDETTPYGRVGDLSHLSKVYVEQLARMIGVPFASVRLGVTYGLSPIMKHTPQFMTVPNLFCQRAVRGEHLRVLEDRPMGFIHVEDAAAALLAAARSLADASADTWRAFNAAPEVLGIGQVARCVQQQAHGRGRTVRIVGAKDAEPRPFQVGSSLGEYGFQPRHTMDHALGEVLSYFEALPA